MIDAVMINEVITIYIDQIVQAENSIDKIEIDQGMTKIIDKVVLEVIQGHIKIMKDKTVEESAEIITEMKVIAEVGIGTGLEKDHFQEPSVMIETLGVQAIAGPDQDQEQVQIGTESGVTDVGNMIISQRTVLPPGKKENKNIFNKCLT